MTEFAATSRIDSPMNDILADLERYHLGEIEDGTERLGADSGVVLFDRLRLASDIAAGYRERGVAMAWDLFTEVRALPASTLRALRHKAFLYDMLSYTQEFTPEQREEIAADWRATLSSITDPVYLARTTAQFLRHNPSADSDHTLVKRATTDLLAQAKKEKVPSNQFFSALFRIHGQTKEESPEREQIDRYVRALIRNGTIYTLDNSSISDIFHLLRRTEGSAGLRGKSLASLKNAVLRDIVSLARREYGIRSKDDSRVVDELRNVTGGSSLPNRRLDRLVERHDNLIEIEVQDHLAADNLEKARGAWDQALLYNTSMMALIHHLQSYAVLHHDYALLKSLENDFFVRWPQMSDHSKERAIQMGHMLLADDYAKELRAGRDIMVTPLFVEEAMKGLTNGTEFIAEAAKLDDGMSVHDLARDVVYEWSKQLDRGEVFSVNVQFVLQAFVAWKAGQLDTQ